MPENRSEDRLSPGHLSRGHPPGGGDRLRGDRRVVGVAGPRRRARRDGERPGAGAEARLRATVAAQWPALEAIGLAPDASPERLRFVAGTGSGRGGCRLRPGERPRTPRREARDLRRLDAAAAPDVVLATSSSGLKPSDHPGRLPPSRPRRARPPVQPAPPRAPGRGGGRIGDRRGRSVAVAMAFYTRLGKRPIRLRRELTGHVANRLQAACGARRSTSSAPARRASPTSTPPSRTGPACAGR